MNQKLRQLVITSLKRNYHTSKLPLQISIKGYNVMVSGSVPSQKSLREAIGTIQAVSPLLNVKTNVKVLKND